MNDSTHTLLFAFNNNVHVHYTLSYSARDDVYAVLYVFQPKGAIIGCHVVNHHQITIVVLDM